MAKDKTIKAKDTAVKAKDTAVKAKETAVSAVTGVKEAVKEAPAKIKETAKETTAKVKETAKETVTKAKETTAKVKKTVAKEASFVEFSGKQLSVTEITENAKKHWMSANNGVISDIKVYINTNQSKAYYVVNNEDRGEFDI